MRILRNDVAAVIIDVQERLLPHMDNKDEVLGNTVKLIRGLEIIEIPTLVTQQYTKGLGDSLAEIQNAFAQFESIEKTSFSCLDEPLFSKSLKRTGKHFVIVAGIEAHVCVFQTVMDLINSGYQPVVIENCVSSRNIIDKESALRRMEQSGAIITTFESVLFELVRNAKDANFKEISKLVK